VAHEAGLPFAALRAVSDPVGQVLPSCVRHALDPHGRVRPLALAAGLARRPWQALTLVRLAGGVRRAERALRGALLVTLPLLAASRSGTAR
jgi:hypothetical protein